MHLAHHYPLQPAPLNRPARNAETAAARSSRKRERRETPHCFTRTTKTIPRDCYTIISTILRRSEEPLLLDVYGRQCCTILSKNTGIALIMLTPTPQSRHPERFGPYKCVNATRDIFSTKVCKSYLRVKMLREGLKKRFFRDLSLPNPFTHPPTQGFL